MKTMMKTSRLPHLFQRLSLFGLKAEFVTTVECMKTDHGIKIDKNIYLMGQSAQIIIGDVIFDVYISDIR